MTKIYIDTNIFFNVWNEEIDPKSGKALWKGSKELLDKIETKEWENHKEYTIENARSRKKFWIEFSENPGAGAAY